jgi:serine/threonine-protein kinase
VSAEPQKTDEDYEREEEEAQQALLAERVGLVVGGRYKIVRTLGAGGMGGVYEAEHELIGKRVALKCLHREYTRDRDLVERFKREARAATAIGNEHIVDVTDMGDLPDGAPFLVMEMLSGKTLSGLIEEEGPMRIARAVHVARQVCDALGAAHDKGIVHRDLKPENVFLTRRGGDPDFVKVLDFGISKMHSSERRDRGLTRTGMAIGTPSYMSPEQAQGLRDVDARTDIWALGVILYEMLAGRRPFDAESYPMLLMRIVGQDPEPVARWRKDVPDALSAIVMQCLVKPMGSRMQSMRELGTALAPFGGVDTVPDIVREEPRGEPGRTAVLGGRRDQSAASHAATQMAGGIAVSGDSGVRVAGGTRAQGGDGEQPMPLTTHKTPAPSAAAPASAASQGVQYTGEIGSVARTDMGAQRTGVIGSVARDVEDDERPRSVPPPPARSNAPLIALGVGVLVLGGLGLGWLVAGSGPPPVSVALPPSSVAPPPTTVAEAPPPSSVAPTEVRVRISVLPTDATIRIGEVAFPNPMDALQPRQLTPVQITMSRDGYRSIERLVIFDSDQNFHFELARGHGVEREASSAPPSSGAQPHEPGAGTHAGGAPPGSQAAGVRPPPTSAASTGDGFRDQF